MKVIVTGCTGYLGSLLVPELMRRGWDVLGIDTGFYREVMLSRGGSVEPRTLLKDTRHLEQADFEGAEAVVHLAELSNDPAGQMNPEATFEINHRGSVRLAELAKKAGVRRFVYTSSCSVYGVSDQELVDEQSPTNPQTAYAICKTLVERDVGAMADDQFCPTFLRNATAYGASPRMRFDIVLNNLAGLAWTTKEIRMTSDGTPWRPLVHALDIAEAIAQVLAAPCESVHNQVLNVGDTAHNYRVREIAEIVADVFPGCRLTFGPAAADNRSYRVSFEKIRRHLPGFQCRWDVRRGAQQLHELFRRIALTPDLFQHRAFTRLKMLEHLRRTGQIDEHLFWTW